MHPYELLSSEQVARVHEASLTIMAEVGLDFRHPEALAVLKKGGAKVDGHRVFFPGAPYLLWVVSPLAVLVAI